MTLEVVRVREEEKLILSHLLELYHYDFSDFPGRALCRPGCFLAGNRPFDKSFGFGNLVGWFRNI